jgi:hypothetical protein
LPKANRDKLRRRARSLGQTESELLRHLIEKEVDPPPLGPSIKDLQGTFIPKGTPHPDSWREAIRRNNWRE